MEHVEHLRKNKSLLELRSHAVKAVREFFWSQGFLEVETPLILRHPGQEPYLSPMPVAIHDERDVRYNGYLHTSPEYTMKKMLAAGFEKIFSLGKCFRDQESFGGTHNPEFTMIEWYRTDADMGSLMDDVDSLFKFLNEKVKDTPALFGLERLHMRDAWQKYAGVNLDEFLERGQMYGLCFKKGYKPKADEPFDDLFFRIFLNEIEPRLGLDHPVALHHYPASMAALSKISKTDPRYAERVEIYAGGMELANGFSELTDPDEQLTRLTEEREYRKKIGKEVYDIDMEFIAALRAGIPPSAGIALGIDRLVQVISSCQNINDVISLPASKLFL